MTDAELPTSAPCPPWCTEQPGHPFHETIPGSGELQRTHTSCTTPQPVRITLEVYESALTETGPTDLGMIAPTIVVYLDHGNGADLDSATARQIAARLVTAADHLDQLHAS